MCGVRAGGAGAAAMVSVVLVTYNRLGMLQRTVGALRKHAERDCEIIIWDNASTDGSSQWLDSLDDPRVRIIHSKANIGCNAYELGFRQAQGEWLLEMDDDVIELPEKFMERMRQAFEACKDLGYLALDVVRDERTNGRKAEEYAYRNEQYGEIVLQFGPVGGWCAMTPVAVYEQVHFPTVENARYYYEDGMYIHGLTGIGYRAAILQGAKCYHAAGPWWNREHQEYWRECHAEQPDELRKMDLLIDKGILIKDTQRAFSIRKCLGDFKRFLRSRFWHAPR